MASHEGSQRPLGIALAAWVALIWGHSLVPGPASTAESDAAASVLGPALAALGITGTRAMTLVIRKAAHVSEYAVLGLMASGLRRGPTVRTPRVGLAVCLLVPFVDELLIQRLVPGRSGSVADVAIDLAGCACGAALRALVTRWRPPS